MVEEIGGQDLDFQKNELHQELGSFLEKQCGLMKTYLNHLKMNPYYK